MNAARGTTTCFACRVPRFLLRGLLLPVFALFPGCRNHCELVEAELRSREAQVEEMKQELDRRDGEIQALEVALDRVHQGLKPGPAPAASSFVVKRIVLGRLTSGLDEKPDCPGDEALQILLEPRDPDDQSIKAPGALHVELFEVSPEGLKSLLSRWDVSPRALRRSWETPVFGNSGYRVVLPWTVPPATEQLRVVVQFTTLEGGKFEADKDLTVRLLERSQRSAPWPMPPPSETIDVAPEEGEPLPLPREMDRPEAAPRESGPSLSANTAPAAAVEPEADAHQVSTAHVPALPEPRRLDPAILQTSYTTAAPLPSPQPPYVTIVGAPRMAVELPPTAAIKPPVNTRRPLPCYP
jgi:hypothetical protein